MQLWAVLVLNRNPGPCYRHQCNAITLFVYKGRAHFLEHKRLHLINLRKTSLCPTVLWLQYFCFFFLSYFLLYFGWYGAINELITFCSIVVSTSNDSNWLTSLLQKKNRTIKQNKHCIKLLFNCLSYWAAGSGNCGFTHLQKQLHPEVHRLLLRRFHLG